MRRYRDWLDLALSLVTVIVALVAAYLLATERVIPALRGEPVAVDAGEQLPVRLVFERLGAGRGWRGSGRPLVSKRQPSW